MKKYLNAFFFGISGVLAFGAAPYSSAATLKLKCTRSGSGFIDQQYVNYLFTPVSIVLNSTDSVELRFDPYPGTVRFSPLDSLGRFETHLSYDLGASGGMDSKARGNSQDGIKLSAHYQAISGVTNFEASIDCMTLNRRDELGIDP